MGHVLVGSRPGQRQQPVGEMNGPLRPRFDLQQRFTQCGRIVLVQRKLGLRGKAGERRSQLVRGMGDEPALRFEVRRQPRHQPVDRRNQRLQFGRRRGRGQWRQVGGITVINQQVEAFHRRDHVSKPVADQCERAGQHEQLWHQRLDMQLAGEPLPLVQRFGDLHDQAPAGPRRIIKGDRRDPHRLAFDDAAVERDSRNVQRARDGRQLGIAGDHRAILAANRVVDGIDPIAGKPAQCFGRHDDRVVGPAGRLDARRERLRQIAELFVIGSLRCTCHHEQPDERGREPEKEHRRREPLEEEADEGHRRREADVLHGGRPSAIPRRAAARRSRPLTTWPGSSRDRAR
jgi:hypothetical protein